MKSKLSLQADFAFDWARIDGTQISNLTEADLISNLVPYYSLKLNYQHNDKWSFALLGQTKYYLFDTVDSRQTFDESNYTTNSFGIEAKRYYKSFSFWLQGIYKQYLEYTAPFINEIDMNTNWNPTVILGADYEYKFNRKYSLGAALELSYLFSNDVINNGNSARVEIFAKRYFHRHSIGAAISYKALNKDSDFVEMKQKELGLILSYHLQL